MQHWSILLFLILNLGILYFSPRCLLWAGLTLFYLLVCYHMYWMSAGLVFIFAAIIVAVLVINFATPLKLPFLKQLYYFFQSKLPPISNTEAVALNAGDSWFEKEIYNGKPNFEILHNIKPHVLSKEEEEFFNNETEQLCAMVNDWQVSQDLDLPEDVWSFLKKSKFFGLVIPKEYGGKGFSAAAHSDIVLKVATRSVSAAVTVMVPNSLGPGELLLHYGTDEQKKYYLPRLADGLEIPCFALTGPYSGSDAVSMSDTGTVCYGEYEGEKILGIKLTNVNKRYITLAPVATLIGLAFKLEDPDNLLQGHGVTGITCVLLKRDLKGLEIGNRLLPMQQAFMNGTVRIKEAFIPLDWIIGGQAMAGQGWRMLVECLSIGRSISLPACGTANSLFNSVTASAYSLIREQFKLSIGNFEGIEEQLANIIGTAYAANSTRQFTVAAVDAGIKPAVASAISKYHLTEMGRDSINRSMDIHAGKAIIMGPNNYIAKGYMGIPVGITVEGANIMTRSLLIFGQGMMHCHPYLRKLYETLSENKGITSIKQFDSLLSAIFANLAQNKVRAIFHGLTCGMFAKGYKASKFNCYYKQITRLSSAFAYVSDVILFILGGELKRKERLSARLGDVISYLYIASATLKQFKDQNQPIDDEIYVEWALKTYLYKAQEALIDVCDNFNIKAIGWIMKKGIFPYGRTFNKPSDKLERKISQAFMHDTSTRHKFKNYCYVTENPEDGVGKLEAAYQAMLSNMDIRKKIHVAVKKKILPSVGLKANLEAAVKKNIISESEAISLDKLLQLIDAVIQVDEFTFEELKKK